MKLFILSTKFTNIYCTVNSIASRKIDVRLFRTRGLDIQKQKIGLRIHITVPIKIDTQINQITFIKFDMR